MASGGRYQRIESEDDERLPAGMTRTGYDADEQRYYYEDANGSAWEGEPGNRYGQLHRVGERPTHEGVPTTTLKRQEREAWRYFLPFLVLVGVFLLLIFRLTHGNRDGETKPECTEGAKLHQIIRGDTCYEIAHAQGSTVEDLQKANEGLECDNLPIGRWICVP